MAVYWMAEVIPLPATALMPMFLFPMLGVRSAKDLADTNMLIVGGLMVAVAIESSNLHRRIALGILRLVGVKRRWLMLGFMLPTWFLSMWISNTATTAMMFPVAQAVLDQFKLGRHISEPTTKTAETTGAENNGFTPNSRFRLHCDASLTTSTLCCSCTNSRVDGPSTSDKGSDDDDDDHKNFCKCLALSIAYSANVGGVATLNGTPPNLIFKNNIDEIYERHGVESPVTFTSWMIFGVPFSAACLVMAWVWLQVLYLNLGFAEGVNVFFFLLLACLWFFRDPKFVTGWGIGFEKGYVTDASSAIFVCVILFAFPKHFPRFDGSKSTGALLDWKSVPERFPWSVILLLGGGFALADVSKESGLSQLIGGSLVVFKSLPGWLVVVLVVALVAGLTEFTSNTATSSLLLPIIGDLSIQLGMNPIYLMMPGTIAASFAFMLPVATPPNAIVFAHGYLTVADMVSLALFVFSVTI
ncbi:hypothetical protein NP493_221g00005 [Ridgeia piscesae]|uniref:Citrate transporter-like domain-containing protein n=1 Tax=Ridgeia piscesae TaxID=27915 RepID=A0AAD9UDW4_RIDPI|nr:hypothetical protein NP493_221g00005 [Ridgeia piscesae]